MGLWWSCQGAVSGGAWGSKPQVTTRKQKRRGRDRCSMVHFRGKPEKPEDLLLGSFSQVRRSEFRIRPQKALHPTVWQPLAAKTKSIKIE